MIDKIEIGEYIRTIDGYIRKIDNINTGRKITIYGEHILDIPYKNSKSVAKKKIIKHSKNIIDLIEVGDYVNGKLIHKVDIRKDSAYIYYGNCKTFTNYQINSVVTHQQFKEMEYRVWILI